MKRNYLTLTFAPATPQEMRGGEIAMSPTRTREVLDRARKALAATFGPGTTNDVTCIQDLVTDLIHLTEATDHSVQEMLTAAWANYDAERHPKR